MSTPNPDQRQSDSFSLKTGSTTGLNVADCGKAERQSAESSTRRSLSSGSEGHSGTHLEWEGVSSGWEDSSRENKGSGRQQPDWVSSVTGKTKYDRPLSHRVSSVKGEEEYSTSQPDRGAKPGGEEKYDTRASDWKSSSSMTHCAHSEQSVDTVLSKPVQEQPNTLKLKPTADGKTSARSPLPDTEDQRRVTYQHGSLDICIKNDRPEALYSIQSDDCHDICIKVCDGLKNLFQHDDLRTLFDQRLYHQRVYGVDCYHLSSQGLIHVSLQSTCEKVEHILKRLFHVQVIDARGEEGHFKAGIETLMKKHGKLSARNNDGMWYVYFPFEIEDVILKELGDLKISKKTIALSWSAYMILKNQDRDQVLRHLHPSVVDYCILEDAPKAVLYVDIMKKTEAVKSFETYVASCNVMATDATVRQEEENKRRIDVLHREKGLAVWKAPNGFEVTVCEGSIGSTDCNVIVLPLGDEQMEWPSVHRHILREGLLSEDIQTYHSKCSDKTPIFLHCNGDLLDGKAVVIAPVPKQIGKAEKQEKHQICDLYTAIFSSRKCKESVAIMVKQSPGIPVDKSAKLLMYSMIKQVDSKLTNLQRVVLYAENPEDYRRVCQVVDKGCPKEWSATSHCDSSSMYHTGKLQNNDKYPPSESLHENRKTLEAESDLHDTSEQGKAVTVFAPDREQRFQTREPVENEEHQAEVQEENSLFHRRVEAGELAALKFLLGEEFVKTFADREVEDGLWCIKPRRGVPAESLMKKVEQPLMHEDIPLSTDEMATLGNGFDVRAAEQVDAFVFQIPEQRKAIVFAFEYDCLVKAKHLVNVKAGKIKVTSRRQRRLDTKSNLQSETFDHQPNTRAAECIPHQSARSPPLQTTTGFTFLPSREFASQQSRQSNPQTSSSPERKDFWTNSGLQISIYKTDITKLKVDAVVNAANGGLAHAGGVAYAISKAAGYELEREGQALIRKHGLIPVSQIAVTTGGHMPCQKVFHAVGPEWDKYADKKLCQRHLEDTIFNCLEEAEYFGFSSIALPSISSAIFGVPKEICAASYASAVRTFEENRRRQRRSLDHIHFVDILDGMITVIQKAFAQMFEFEAEKVETKPTDRTTPAPGMTEARGREEVRSQHSTGERRSRASRITDSSQQLGSMQNPTSLSPNGKDLSDQVEQTDVDERENKMHQRRLDTESNLQSETFGNQPNPRAAECIPQQSAGSPFLQTNTGFTSQASREFNSQLSRQSNPQTSSSPERKDFWTDSGLHISVYKTDITKLKVDAVVNAANGGLAHAGGVAYAISKAAGYELEREGQALIRKRGLIPVSQIAVTTGGHMPCQKVFHAVGPEWDKYADKKLCQRLLEDTIFNCLEEAEYHGFSSIALPSISSAIFGVPKEICAASYASAVRTFEENRRRQRRSLDHIHFVDILDGMITVIQKAFAQMFEFEAEKVETKPIDRTTPAPGMTEARGREEVRSQHSTGERRSRASRITDSSQQLGSMQNPTSFSPSGKDLSDQVEQKDVHERENKMHFSDLVIVFQQKGGDPLSPEVAHFGHDCESITIDTIEKFVEDALDAADKNKKRSVMISNLFGNRDGMKDSTEAQVLSEARTCVYQIATAVSIYSSRQERSVTKLHIIEPDKRILNSMLDEVECFKEKGTSGPDPTASPARAAESRSSMLTDASSTDRGSGHSRPGNSDIKNQSQPEHLSGQAAFQAGDPGTTFGDQPKGKIGAELARRHNSGPLTYNVICSFPGGIQKDTHPKPGVKYRRTNLKASLPFTDDGAKVFRLLQKAFKHGCLFSVCYPDVIDVPPKYIHLRHLFDSKSKIGDVDLQQVEEELAEMGITDREMADTEKNKGSLHTNQDYHSVSGHVGQKSKKR